MSAYLLVGLTIAVVVMTVFYFIVRKAPMGYEDKNGFHYGDEP